MRAPRPISKRRGERGQTILLVVISLISLLAMAALAIDVVTLYLARAEIQRAADAAALAGAKAIADSGATTDPGQLALGGTMCIQAITDGSANGILQQNLVAGRPPQVVGSLSASCPGPSNNGNPIVTVTLQQTNLPIFFARIWGGGLATVRATASAEAYNPSSSQAVTGATVAIAPRCVKPWLVPNADPILGGQFIVPSTGAVVNPGVAPTGVIGQRFTLTSQCAGSGPCVTPPIPVLSAGTYLPAVVGSFASTAVPPCGTGGSVYEQGIVNCDDTAYTCGGLAPNAAVDTSITDPGVPGGDTEIGTECLIHASGTDLGQGQDILDLDDYISSSGPIQIKAGINNPLIGSLVTANSLITTSSSVVTIPIFDNTGYPADHVKVIGFLQGFIEQVKEIPGKSQVQVAVLNVSGCGTNLAGPPPGPIRGGGVSSVPVRLIHQ